MSREQHSMFLWLAESFSNEELFRSLLVADTIQLPFSALRYPDAATEEVVSMFLDRGLLALTEDAAYKTWVEQLRQRHSSEWREWYFYFAKAMCRGFAQRRATVEWHEAGHRIAYAWDDGSGVFPPQLFPHGPVVTMHTPRPSTSEMIEELEDELRRDRYGASAPEADYAASAALTHAQDKLLLDCAIHSIEVSAKPYIRLGLLAAVGSQVRWLAGLLSKGVFFDCIDPEATSAVVSAVLGRSDRTYRLSDIPPEQFADLCESLSEARQDFSFHAVKWAESIAAIDTPQERRSALARLYRDEIVPAMQDFNVGLRGRLYGALGALQGSQYAQLGLGSFSAAAALALGLPLETVVAAGTGTAVAGAAASVGKQLLTDQRKRKRQWTAFCSALSDSLRKLEAPGGV